MNWIRIPYEEARLRETFGEDYADYCRRVRRWI
jgi:protein-S-isoprenylcysteine O-methyltransferase Ste14